MSRWMIPARCRATTARAIRVASWAPSSRPTRRLAVQALFQRLAVVEWHHRIEPGLALGRLLDHLPDPRAAHAAGDEGLVDEGAAIGLVLGDARLRKLDHDLRAVAQILGPRQPAVAPVGEQRVDAVIVDQHPRRGRRRDRQVVEEIAQFARFGGRRVENVDDHRRAIVVAAGNERGGDEILRRLLGRRAAGEDVAQPGVAQRAMHAVAAQQVAFERAQGKCRVVERGPNSPCPRRGARYA